MSEVVVRGFRTKEDLQKFGAVDLTPRKIGKKDEFLVECQSCGKNQRITTWQVAQQTYKKHGYAWRCGECSSAALSATKQGRTVIRADSFRDQETLTSLGLEDSSPRHIKAEDRVFVRCRNHPESLSEQKFNTVFHRYKTMGFGWQCNECFRKGQSETASERTGEKNSFYGKKHKDETRKVIAQKKQSFMASLTKDQKSSAAKIGMEVLYKKHGCNPMHVAEIRENHHEATHTPDFIEGARGRQVERLKNPEYIKLLSEKSKEWWNTEEGGKEKERLHDWIIAEWNSPGGMFYEKRHNNNLLALQEMKEKGILGFCLEPKMYPKERKASKEQVVCGERLAELVGEDPVTYYMGRSEIDMFFKDKKIGIEYNGLWWHSERYRENDYHLKKTEYFGSKEIRLIQMFCHEWKNRQNQIESFLLAAFGKNETIIGARECDLVILDKNEANDFFEQYHIQGSPNSIDVSLGLKHEGDLLCAASFAKHHRDGKQIVLNRFAGKRSVSVSGGMSKISQFASKQVFKKDILTWADRRWSNGRGYLNSGWKQDAILPPDYFYIDKKLNVVSKQGRKKTNVHTPEWMTEHMHARLDGLYRVYDCGKIRFVLPFG